MNRDDKRTLLASGFIAVMIVIVAAALAHAEDVQPPQPRFTCWTVRKAVKIYKEADLIAMARSAGISEAEIEKAKRCLRP